VTLKSIEEEAADCRAAFAGRDYVPGGPMVLVAHLHHEIEYEPLTEPIENRIEYILIGKAQHERALRLHVMRPIPSDFVFSEEMQKADADWQKADADWQHQHSDICHVPDCPWERKDDFRMSEPTGCIPGISAEEAERRSRIERAAPELLAALKESIEIIHVFHGESGWEIYRRNAPEMKRIQDAIAKAEGRA
jgi:hypothetical protein